MTSVINVQTAVIAVIIYVGGWITYCRFFHPLSGIPGPFVASFSRIWVVFKTLAGDMEHTQRNLHKKHGNRKWRGFALCKLIETWKDIWSALHPMKLPVPIRRPSG